MFIFLTWSKLFGTWCTSQIASWRLFCRMYYWNWVFARDVSCDAWSHLNWFSFNTIWNLFISWSSSSLTELEEWEDDEDEHELGDLLLYLLLLCFFFFLRLHGEPDWEPENIWHRFPVFRFVWDLLFFSALYIFEINACYFLTSA